MPRDGVSYERVDDARLGVGRRDYLSTHDLYRRLRPVRYGLRGEYLGDALMADADGTGDLPHCQSRSPETSHPRTVGWPVDNFHAISIAPY